MSPCTGMSFLIPVSPEQEKFDKRQCYLVSRRVSADAGDEGEKKATNQTGMISTMV